MCASCTQRLGRAVIEKTQIRFLVLRIPWFWEQMDLDMIAYSVVRVNGKETQEAVGIQRKSP